MVRVSVIIPTYQRRETVLRSVSALTRQVCDCAFEVIVVVDGSSDGTAESLTGLDVSFDLSVLEQNNSGAATARNRGAQAARGEILLFLDDDMEADPGLIRQHDLRHRSGADVVIGDIPLHPQSPVNLLSRDVGRWAEKRRQRLSDSGSVMGLEDFLTGQISIGRELFCAMGGFDVAFTRDGTFGNEDVDFGYRLLREGKRIEFDPSAISWQRYVVTPRQFLRQWRQAGRADVVLARKHPTLAEEIFSDEKCNRRQNRKYWRPAARVPWLSAPFRFVLRWLAVTLVARGRMDGRTKRLMTEARWSEYWRGVAEAGGIPDGRSAVVLAYHAIADHSGDKVLCRYGVPPGQFIRQLDTLRRLGCHFISASELIEFLSGKGLLPRRAIMVTFDDCYRDLLEVAMPILKARGIPAVAFAVSGCIGGENSWDEGTGASRIPLLDLEGLKELERSGVEIGAHSKTHCVLPRIGSDQLAEEIGGSVSELEQQGLRRPRMFGYPYGKYDERCREAVARAGIQAAFSTRAGVVGDGSHRSALRRVEVFREDSPGRLLWKICRAHLLRRRKDVRTEPLAPSIEGGASGSCGRV